MLREATFAICSRFTNCQFRKRGNSCHKSPSRYVHAQKGSPGPAGVRAAHTGGYEPRQRNWVSVWRYLRFSVPEGVQKSEGQATLRVGCGAGTANAAGGQGTRRRVMRGIKRH